MRIFNNGFHPISNKEGYETAKRSLAYHLDTIRLYSFLGFSIFMDDDEILNAIQQLDELSEVRELLEFCDDHGPFNEWGLCFDFVEQENEQDPYYRYQISYGGPSTEFRFYEDGQVVFVYLDWFVGVSFDVTSEDGIQELKYYFSDCGVMNFRQRIYDI